MSCTLARSTSPLLTRRGIGGLTCAALCLVASPTWAGPPPPSAANSAEPAASPGPKPRRFALVVGTNVTKAADQAPLRYADDDAARVASLLSQAGVAVELLTTFDAESQQLYPEWVTKARRPSPGELEAARKRLEAAIVVAKADGAPTELIVYYSGHGDVGSDGVGAFNLEGGELTRRALFKELIGGSSADRKHLLIDACRSEELIMARGSGSYASDRGPAADAGAMRRYLGDSLLAGHPDTGVILAVSADQQTHEWERYRGGIFTHQLLSALRGGADVNGDGALEYSEIGAFVAAANSGVSDPRARLSVVVRPPQADQRAPLLVHDEIAEQRVVLFVGRDDHRYVLEDARGVRLADLHRDGTRPGYLRLPERGPVFVYRQRADQPTAEEATIASDHHGVVLARQLAFKPAERASRGAVDEAFRQGLFAVPFGLGYYAGFRDREGLLGITDPDWEVRVWKRQDGELVEVTRVTASDDPEREGPCRPEAGRAGDDEPSEPKRAVWDWWGSFQFGTELTPFDPGAEIRLDPKRVIANEFGGFGGAAKNLRGFDARWSIFTAEGPWDYPAGEAYFRTGYTQGFADFLPEDEGIGFLPDQATRLEYFSVPLFFGGHLYAPLRRFPVRPLAGAGFGFDVLSLDYRREGRANRQDVSARIGFELHAGLDIRISNFASIVGEVRQLWSARRRLSRLPDFSNEGLTIITALRVAIPLHRRGWAKVKAQPRSPEREPDAGPPSPEPTPAVRPPATGPSPRDEPPIAEPALEPSVLEPPAEPPGELAPPDDRIP